ncbi:hypothetical protein B0H14DRAFT_2557496 [Mycena olivaceomarginata]|nr:hypothetical protein B0H14DRAFT_2557496 [Mycena olivaceomarginata]
MHGVHLLDLDALNKWLASVEMRTLQTSICTTLLPDKEAICKLYAGFHQGMTSRVYVLVLSAFHHSETAGTPDVLLWVCRLPMHKQLHFPQPLAFVAKLFTGMTDIPRGSVLFGEESVLQLWIAAPKALECTDRRWAICLAAAASARVARKKFKAL